MTTFIAATIGRGVSLLTPVADGTPNQVMVTNGSGTLSFATISGGVTDHGALTGLLDDDHTQHPLLAGRAGGQTQYGGNAANDDYTIEGTSHATKTTSYVLLQPNGGNVGIGTTGPSQKLTVLQTSAGAETIPLFLNNRDNTLGTAVSIGLSPYSGDTVTNKVTAIRDNTGYSTTFSTWDTSLRETMRLTGNGNVGIGTTSPGGGSTVGTKVLSLGNGTVPVGGVANQISFYSADVSALAEAFVLDESGFATQLSAHDSDQLNRHPTRAQQIGVIPLKTTWTFNAHNPHAGIVTRCDVGLGMRAVEKLWQRVTGKPLVLIDEKLEGDKLPWEANQNKQRDARVNEQTEWDKRSTERLAVMRRRASIPFWMREPKPALLSVRPDDFEIKPKPQWLVNAEAA